MDELHRQFILADSDCSTALDVLLFCEELEEVAPFIQLRADFLCVQEVSLVATEKYFVAISELLTALAEAEAAIHTKRRSDVL